ncbi:dihydrofolate reductase family protein [Nocardioides sp. 1609]|uniref:dihydrofolate reductase family protein n=1 Tax=Nocardioides sp. 1609 TaxID=2508327 RepID=UPI001070660E|nr:dihydrofolate reductase family protein [Nocardioides sp. 1609]
MTDQRRLVVTQNTTLDGAIQMLDDWFDDQRGVDDPEFLAENHRQDAAADALLVGRQTFTDFRGYWRDLEDDATGISDYLNGVEKYVVSSTLTDDDLDWQHSTVLRGDVVEEVRALKDRPGRDIVCTGSLTLLPVLVGADLVDEYRLFVYPVVQGRGTRLFPDGHRASGLRLLEARSFATGVALLRYAAH